MTRAERQEHEALPWGDAPAEPMDGQPAFSVVIPTYNEERDISATLERVLAQTVPPVDVIVVDGGSSDATVPLLRGLAERHGVMVIEEGRRRGVAAARNAGIRAARGDVIVVLNADVLLPPDFIARLVPHYLAGYDLVSVESRVHNMDAVTGRYVNASHLLHYGPQTVGWSEGFSCRRRAALDVAFPEQIPGAGGEDVEFVDRLLRAGYRWKVDYSIVVHHQVPARLREFWGQYRGRGKAVPYIEYSLKKWPLPLVTVRRLLAWGKTAVVAASIAPNAIEAARLARRSPRGVKDLPALWLTHHVHSAALRTGEAASLGELWRKRGRAA